MPDATTLATVKVLFEALGTTSTVLAVALVGLFLAYRRDHLRKQVGLREAHEHRDRREERSIAVAERTAVAIEGLSRGMEESSRSFREALDRQARDLTEIIRSVRGS